MMKILQAGVKPSSICALIYQHYDPDLVGSVHNFEEIIGKKDLKIISDASNNMFIRHYYVESSMTAIDAIKHRYEFSSGRRLEFINTPYAHSQGSFITYDPKTGILFTSDLFGSLGGEWELFLKLEKECRTCDNYEPQNCPNRKSYCPLPDILRFHANLMPSSRILKLAMEKITRIPATLIAPQHGSIIHNPEDIRFVSELLSSMQQVGIDKLL
jgi:flavorubredoxin